MRATINPIEPEAHAKQQEAGNLAPAARFVADLNTAVRMSRYFIAFQRSFAEY
jgi:hypothetical protein